MKEVGPLFAEIIRYKNIERKELAKNIGVSPQQIGVLLKGNASNWKLSYFDLACKFLHVHPKSFFDNWKDDGNVITGTIENNAILGTSNFNMGSTVSESNIEKELRKQIEDKENIIEALKKIIDLQESMLRSAGLLKEEKTTDA